MFLLPLPTEGSPTLLGRGPSCSCSTAGLPKPPGHPAQRRALPAHGRETVCVCARACAGLHGTFEKALRASRQGHRSPRASHRARMPQAPTAGAGPLLRRAQGPLCSLHRWLGKEVGPVQRRPVTRGEVGSARQPDLVPSCRCLELVVSAGCRVTSQPAWARRRRNEGQV